MIGYIVQGSSASFGNIIDYANDPKKGAKMIGCTGGVFTLDNRTIADSFEMQAAMNPRLGSPMSHIILSFSARDTRSLTDRKMAEIAEESAVEKASARFEQIGTSTRAIPTVMSLPIGSTTRAGPSRTTMSTYAT